MSACQARLEAGVVLWSVAVTEPLVGGAQCSAVVAESLDGIQHCCVHERQSPLVVAAKLRRQLLVVCPSLAIA